ncbi:MAG: hypothetical protein M3Y76_05615 [Chloroflexota bacterium]|nr:hypothetical protein [Chloroflexota bacterium]
MIDTSSFPVFDEMVVHMKALIEALNQMGRERLDVALQRRNGLPYDEQRLQQLEREIDTSAIEYQKAVLVASEYFSNGELSILRKRIGMNIFQWRVCYAIRLQ